MATKRPQSTQWVSAMQLADMLTVSENAVRAWARKVDDPMPIHYPPGNKTQFRVYLPEFNEWALRTWRR